MDYFYVDISTELGESLTTYVQAMDETQRSIRQGWLSPMVSWNARVRRLFTSVLIGGVN